MTFDERLAALGVETSDILPSNEHCNNLYEKFFALTERICKEMGEEGDLEMLLSFLLIAIAKRDNIIDLMETRIVNLTVERDYLQQISGELAEECGYSTEYDGVPEYWSADDD